MQVDLEALSDPTRWQVTLLPLPKRQSRAKALGLCGGQAVGASEGSGYRLNPAWWPGGQPQPLEFAGQKRLAVGFGHDRVIPGSWEKAGGGKGRAVGWRLEEDGALTPVDLHDAARWAWTVALAAGGGCFAGYGERKVQRGERALEQALFWGPDGVLCELPTEAGCESMAHATDGVFVAGQVRRQGAQQAVLWRAEGGPPVELAGPYSEARGVRDGEQVGGTARKMLFSAALWRGTPESHVELTPEGYETALATDCAAGLQVGHARERDRTRGGTGSMATEAVLWNGSPKRWLSLQRLLPPPWNASAAWAIEVAAGRLRIVGEATHYGVQNELTSQELHVSLGQSPVIWEARLP